MFDPAMIKDAPDSPGVYLMWDGAGQVLYVGKAVSLRKRLHSYTRIDPAARSKTAVMLSKVAKVDTLLTRTEKEALILEAGLIKQHRPRYNVILRDDKSYPHLKVTVQEEWPRLLMTRRVSNDGARYFGPYSSPAAMWETLRLLNSLFPLRRCKTRKFTPGQRACLNYQLGRCPGPCIEAIGQEEYRARVKRVLTILEGRKRELSRELEAQMKAAAARQHFEQAAILRDQLRALNQTLERQVVVSRERADLDVFGLVRRNGQVAAALLFIREGALVDKREFFLAEPMGEDSEVLAELLQRFYEPAERLIPRRILLPLLPDGAAALAEWLSEKRNGPGNYPANAEGNCSAAPQLGASGPAPRTVGYPSLADRPKMGCCWTVTGSVQLLVPRRGDKKTLVGMAGDNAGQVLVAREQQQGGWQRLGEAIRRALKLASIPQRIECLDISNLGGQEAVGSLVSFREGEKESSRYRRFHIRSLDTPDDYAMMREVLLRHLRRSAAEQTLPDLLVLDGGKGQLGVARAVLAELALGPGPELVSIAKDREGSGERLFRPGRKNPLVLAAHSPVLLFFMKIRDEAHRFGITFHRKLRGRKQLSSPLDQIPGVGQTRKQALLKTLGSLSAVAAATPAELAAVPGIGPELAAVIHDHLHAKK